ncbi:MAG: hypothetical protein QOG87_1086 [Actinomycetota bacterium]
MSISSERTAPHDESTFWLGNLAAPYVLIPFLAGGWRFRLPGAVAAGALAGAGLVCGFYNVLATATVTSSMLGLPEGTPVTTRLTQAYAGWVRQQLLGAGGYPWLTIGLVVGAGCGVAGFLWAQGRARLVGTLFALTLVVEPLVYLTGLDALVFPGGDYARSVWNLAGWALEAAAGVLLALAWWRRGRTAA